jgi:hypothetical protein
MSSSISRPVRVRTLWTVSLSWVVEGRKAYLMSILVDSGADGGGLRGNECGLVDDGVFL